MRARYAAVAAALMTLSGCAVEGHSANSPQCSSVGRPGSPPVFLMAQAVPTASLVPCVAAVPAGWAVHSFNARDGKGDFTLSSDLSGSHAVEVVLTATCDVRGATRVPTDQASTTRFERVISLDAGYSGIRYYLFPGGCVRYVFHLKGAARAAPVNDVSLAVSFVTRDQLRKEISRRSRGQSQLDPAT